MNRDTYELMLWWWLFCSFCLLCACYFHALIDECQNFCSAILAPVSCRAGVGQEQGSGDLFDSRAYKYCRLTLGNNKEDSVINKILVVYWDCGYYLFCIKEFICWCVILILDDASNWLTMYSRDMSVFNCSPRSEYLLSNIKQQSLVACVFDDFFCKITNFFTSRRQEITLDKFAHCRRKVLLINAIEISPSWYLLWGDFNYS